MITAAQLVAHAVGDYVLQNHWMATRKTASSAVCAVHAVFYTLPFLVLTMNPASLAGIAIAHFVIDRWRLARLWVQFWGVGCPGWVPQRLRLVASDEPAPPPFLGVWLLIIVDNIAHVLWNAWALSWGAP